MRTRSSLSDKLDTILDYIESSSRLERKHLTNELVECCDMSELVEINCFRCDRPFRTLPDVKYCTKECELGGVQMPYQSRVDAWVKEPK